MWIEFVVDSPLLRGFFSGFSGFLPSAKINISKFQFDRGRGPQLYQLTAVTCILPSLNKDLLTYYPRKTKLVDLFYFKLVCHWSNTYKTLKLGRWMRVCKQQTISSRRFAGRTSTIILIKPDFFSRISVSLEIQVARHCQQRHGFQSLITTSKYITSANGLKYIQVKTH
jgi:hypothetical protein